MNGGGVGHRSPSGPSGKAGKYGLVVCFGEETVKRRDHLGTFASDALDRTGAHVADGEYTWQAGF